MVPWKTMTLGGSVAQKEAEARQPLCCLSGFPRTPPNAAAHALPPRRPRRFPKYPAAVAQSAKTRGSQPRQPLHVTRVGWAPSALAALRHAVLRRVRSRGSWRGSLRWRVQLWDDGVPPATWRENQRLKTLYEAAAVHAAHHRRATGPAS